MGAAIKPVVETPRIDNDVSVRRLVSHSLRLKIHLARSNSRTATICGCGNQGRISLRALAKVLPIERVWAYDLDQGSAHRFASELAEELNIDIEAVDDLQTAVRQSDVCVTCTPATKYFLKEEFVVPGTFIAAVGSDNPEKHELDPGLMSRSKVVVDVLEQCVTIGELHHALNAEALTRDDVYGELGEVIAGIKPGRTSSDDIIIFDSTGMALQDVVTAAAVYENAISEGAGTIINFAE